MGQTTKIAWSDASWTPIRARIKRDALEIAHAKGYTSLVQILTAKKPNGELRSPSGKVGPHCERVSPGCANCYSEANNHRCLPLNGTGLPFDRRSRDLLEIFLDENILAQPLRWKTPRKIFVNSQTDSFAEFVPQWMVDRMMAVVGLCQRHQFQWLTKRAEAQSKYGESVDSGERYGDINDHARDIWAAYKKEDRSSCGIAVLPTQKHGMVPGSYPFPNYWAGISAEDQQRYNERIGWLKQTRARIRFISYEPALGPIDFGDLSGIALVIIGGESGNKARPFNVDWGYSSIQQCLNQKVLAFMKQCGRKPYFSVPGLMEEDQFNYYKFKDRHGGNWNEWPVRLRVRELPE